MIELWKISQLAPHFASAIEVEQALLRCLKKLPQVRELLESDIGAAYKSIE